VLFAGRRSTTIKFMTLMKWVAPSIVLFVFFFVVLYFGICLVGAAINGVIVGANTSNPQDGYEAGKQAGAYFVRHNIRATLMGSLLTSLVISSGLSFSGILPWCRKPSQPPPP
jgi:hypothetical protein